MRGVFPESSDSSLVLIPQGFVYCGTTEIRFIFI